MPLPPASFTRSKWLAFFAELTAKIVHHNVSVVLEGCEVIKRLLVTRVSVAAFLEEGDLLTHLLDTIAGDMLSNARREMGPPLAIAEKLLFTQLETLSLIIDMMVALYADKEDYYCLLVQARAGLLLSTLVTLLQRQHPRFFGIIATMVHALLGLPLGRGTRGLDLDVSHTSVALGRHVQQLQAAVGQHAEILHEAVETLRALSLSLNGPVRCSSAVLLRAAERRLRRAQRDVRETAPAPARVSPAGLNQSEAALNTTASSVPGMKCSRQRQHEQMCGTALNEMTESFNATHDNSDEALDACLPDSCIPEESEFANCFERIATCTSHDEFFVMMNRLWCLTVAAGSELQRRFTGVQFDRAFRRFLQTMPSNQQDQMLFTSVLLWLSHMMSSYELRSDARDSILSVAGSALIQIVVQDLQHREVLEPRDCTEVSSIPAANSFAPSVSLSQTECASPVMIRSASTKSQALVERPSISFVVLSFLLIAERACGAQEMERWIHEAGLFVLIDALVRAVENKKSALIDTPTTMDGALSDEVYLNCAMASARTEHVTLAVLACKLLSSVVWNHYTILGKQLVPEASAMLQTTIPLLLKIAIHNPTLTSAVENMSGSALHHSPSCQRSSRYTTLGECSLVALDACVWLMDVAQLDAVHVKNIIPNLPALSRASRNSIHPPLRAAVYRCLARLCTTPAELVIVICEMPSVVNAAVTSVLEYSPSAPQWESAAAADWIAHVMRVAESDAKVEQSFNFTRSALPVKLIELAALNGITYATAALLSLVTSLFQQQQRFADQYLETSTSVLLPYGRRSLKHWFHLMRLATQANEKLAQVGDVAIPAATTTKDALSRSLSSIEGISVQFSFVCSLARGLLLLLKAHPEYREHFTNVMVYELIASALALPPVDAVFKMLTVRFGVRVDQHAILERTYESLLQWTMELCAVWLTTPCELEVAAGLPPIPQEIYTNLSCIMQNSRTSQRTRASAAALVSSILSVPSIAFREGLAATSGELFAASLSVTPVTCVRGMQCRLVALFRAANDEAHTCGWFATRITDLEKHTQSLREAGGVFSGPSPHDAMESLLIALSCVSSVMANVECRALTREVLQPIAASLRTLLGYIVTRRQAFQAARALAGSGEGRRCLLHEATAAGDPIARTCFGRVLGLTFDAPLGERLQRENDCAMRRVPFGEREAMRLAVGVIGYDICATACGRGGEVFGHTVLKMKGVEHIEELLLNFERQRTPAPLGLFRLLAALSFQTEAQKTILRRGELMTILIETAANATSVGTLALLTLRNLCFHTGLKTKLCQDSRVLLTLKAALMAQPTLQPLMHNSNSPESRGNMRAMMSLKGEIEVKRTSLQQFVDQSAAAVTRQLLQQRKRDGNSPVLTTTTTTTAMTGSFDRAEVLRRQELAVTAFWSLMYDNQRGKSYVRGILNQVPSVNMSKLVISSNELGVSSPELQQYPEKMSEAIGNIKLLGKGLF